MFDAHTEPQFENVEIKIIMRRRPDGSVYVGAGTTYDPREKEDWRRGNDLADGTLSQETLKRIFADISAVSRGYRNAYEEEQEASE